MPANRTGFTKQITLWNKGPQYIQKHDGFGHTFDLKGIVEGTIPGGYVLDYEQGTDVNVYLDSAGRVPSLRLIDFPDGTSSLISFPYLHVWPTQAKSHWTFQPSSNEWSEYRGELGELNLDHAYSNSVNLAYAESAFKLPPDPWFAVRLQRGEPNEDWPSGKLPFTYIEFGKEYRIVMPYGGPVRLYIKGVDAWLAMKPEDGEGLSGFEGLDHNDKKRLCIGCLRGHILLSDDAFGSSIAFYKIPVGDQYVGEALTGLPRYWTDPAVSPYPRVWSAKVSVGHNAGDFGFTYYPVWPVRHKTPTASNAPYMVTPSINFDYNHTEGPVRPAVDGWIEPHKAAWDTQSEFEIVENSPATWTVPSVLMYSGSVYTAWLDIGWQPLTWIDPTTGTYSHLVAPAIHQAQLWQPAWIGSVAGTSNILSAGWATRLSLENLEVSAEEEFGPMMASLRFVEGKNAYLCRLLKPFQRIRIKLGTRYSGGISDTATVFDGYTATPGLSTLAGLHDDVARGDWRAFDDVKRGTDAKAHQREPAFDLFSVSGAATWIWGRIGVPSAHLSFATQHATRILHGLGREVAGANRTYQGFVKDDRWSPEAGTEWLAVLKDIARAANNSQWWADPVTRTYKLTNGWWPGTVSHLIREGPLGHAQGAYRVFEFNVENRSFDSDEFANRVTLLGKDVDGNPIWGTRKDTSSAWGSGAANFAGRWIDHVDTRDDLRTTADLEAAADSMLAALSKRADRATITTDPIISLRRGHLLKTSGGTNGAFDLFSCVNAKWLVTGYGHSWNKADGPMGLRTTAQLRWWGY